MSIDEKAFNHALRAYRDNYYATADVAEALISAFEAYEAAKSDSLSVNIPIGYGDAIISGVIYNKKNGGGFEVNIKEFTDVFD